MANYIIAVGGTGAKVLRSIIHLCDCGYFGVSRNEGGQNRMGVPSLKLLLIDADTQCGNTTDTELLIRQYNRCQERYNPDGDSSIFKTRIYSVFNPSGPYRDIYAVSPVLNASSSQPLKDFTIKSYLAEEEADRGLGSAPFNFMKALYSQLEYEKNIQEGFYAHPSLGSLMFTRWMKCSSHIRDMFDMIKQDAAREQVRIFVIASSFGGTGASGFPAIANGIKSLFTEIEPNRLLISGVFMLPYFSFLTRTALDADEKLPPPINPATFIENAKGALMFYLRQNSASAYDRVYVLGVPDNDVTRSSKIIRGSYADRGANQKNWPHILELYAALSAYNFFSDNNIYNTETEWIGSSINKEDLRNITWGDLPDGEALRQSMSKFLLFNYIYAPFVLNEFLIVSGSGDSFRFMKKPIGSVNWAPVKVSPFRVGLIRAQWNDSVFNDSKHLAAFTDLYDYFSIHAEWVYKLLFAFPVSGNISLEVKNLFKEAMLRDRFDMTYILRNGNKPLQSIIDNLIRDSYRRLNECLEIKVDAAQLYTEIHRTRANPTDSVDSAVRDIINRVYQQTAAYVK